MQIVFVTKAYYRRSLEMTRNRLVCFHFHRQKAVYAIALTVINPEGISASALQKILQLSQKTSANKMTQIKSSFMPLF